MENMKIKSVVFLSDFFNHHQKPFSDAVFERIGNGYIFIETEKMTDDRIKMGWSQKCHPDYVVSSDTFHNNTDKYLPLIENADVVIIGSAPNNLIRERIRNNRLVLRYSERPLKKTNEKWKNPIRFFKWRKLNPGRKNIRMLCASAYTSADYAKFGLFRNKCYKWGYFPECKYYDFIEKIIEAKNTKQILWCGRFLDWKHPDDVLHIARMLRDDGYSFHVDLIGSGKTEEALKQMITEYNLEDNVSLLGSMPPDKVREHMEKSGIYLFTSDRQEGWGAVLNESMNSGCAVIASHAIGSVPYLLKDGENGCIYESGNLEELYHKVKYLLDNPDKQTKFGMAAYRTVTEEWNAEAVAERFVNLVEHILAGEKYPDLYEDGPCSKAEIIKDNWYTAAKKQ